MAIQISKSFVYKSLLIGFFSIAIFAFFGFKQFKEKYVASKLERLYYCSDRIHVDWNVLDQRNDIANSIVLIGDSRIRAWHEPDLGFPIINLGRDGASSHEILCQLGKSVDIKPRAFIVQLGINDLVAASLKAQPERAAIEQKAMENIAAILAKLTKTNTQIVVMDVVPPINMDLLRKLVWGRNIDLASEQLSKQIKSINHEDIDFFSLRDIFFAHDKRTWKSEYSVDALHWNSQAYQALTENMKAVIN